MIFGPKRAHIFSIFDNFIKDFGLLIATVVIGMIMGNFSLILDNIPVLIIVVLGPFIRLYGYLFTKYSIDDTKLIKDTSFIFHKHLEVPLSTITTVDVSQNVLQQIFKTYTLHIDNASNITDTTSKIHVTFGKEDMETVKGLLIKGREGIDGLNPVSELKSDITTNITDENLQVDETSFENKITRISPTQIMLYGLLEGKGMAIIEVFGVFGFLAALINPSEESEDTVISHIIDAFEYLGTLKALIIAAVLIFIFITIFAVVKCLVKYFGFTLLDNGKALKISYGLFQKKNYTIQKNRITGFSYEQSLLMRVFDVGVLKAFAIGYGGAENGDNFEEPLIYPLISKTKTSKIMSDILPEIHTNLEYVKPKPNSFRYFFYDIQFILSVILLAGLCFVSKKVSGFEEIWILGIIILLLSIIEIVQMYKNTAISGDSKTISLISGGFTKVSVFVKTSSVEYVRFNTSYFKQKKNIGHITIGHIAPLVSATHRVKNLTTDTYEKIRKLLIY